MDSRPARDHLACWLLAFGCYAVLLFFFSPSWAAFAAWSQVPELQGLLEVRRGASVLEQVKNPGAPIADTLHGAIQWRLLFPLIGRLLSLPATWLFALAHVGCVAVLGVAIARLRREGANWGVASLAALALGAAGWFFASTGWLGYFDAWVVLGLLLVAFARHTWTIWAVCVWAPWVDERFVIALPLALLCRWVAASESVREGGEVKANVSVRWKREATIALGLALAFVAVRLGVLSGRSNPNATIGGYWSAFSLKEAGLGRVLLGIWEGARAGWLLAGLAVALAARRSSQRGAAAAWLLTGLAVAVAVVALATAQDFGRSLMLLSPLVLLGAVLLVRAAPRWLLGALGGAVAVTLILPAHHVMSDRVNPIFYLYHELALFRAPPRVLNPEIMELHAIRAMQEGRTDEAERALAMAIKLAPNPTAAAKQRGVLRATLGRWREAGEDFALMAQHEPENPEAWFLCAQSSFALGDAATAATQFLRAVNLAPADWLNRPDVARFRTRLGR